LHRLYLIAREPVMRISTSRLALCCQSGVDEGRVQDQLRLGVGELRLLPVFDLALHGLEVALHAIDSNRDAVDERERLRVLREHRSEHAWDNVTQSSGTSISGLKLR